MGAKLNKAEREALQALHVRLKSDYPKAFGGAAEQPFHRVAPLKRGIHKDIVAAYPDVSMMTVRKFINWYVYTPEYLRLTVLGAARVDLSGEAAGEVTGAEVEHAQTVLAKLAQRPGTPLRKADKSP